MLHPHLHAGTLDRTAEVSAAWLEALKEAAATAERLTRRVAELEAANERLRARLTDDGLGLPPWERP